MIQYVEDRDLGDEQPNIGYLVTTVFENGWTFKEQHPTVFELYMKTEKIGFLNKKGEIKEWKQQE